MSALLGLACAALHCSGTSNRQSVTTSENSAEVCGDGTCTAGESPADCPADCLEIEWIEIEGGSFAMGSKTGPASERPVHDVKLGTFELMKSEATLLAYRACVSAGECTEPDVGGANELSPVRYCNWGRDERNEHPINCISWDQARAFCGWIEGRLPTEAEWEFAARGRGGDAPYPWGEERPTCSLAIMGVEPHHVGCQHERTFPVCSKTRGNTPEGLCDMTGSVIEWVEDEAHESYDDAPNDGSAWVTSPEPENRIARGGSLATRDAAYMRSTVRFAFDGSVSRYVVGVRCAR